MHKLVVTLVSITAALAQTQVDLRTQSKNVDFGSAPSTRPIQTGTALPATCLVGNLFFKTDATAGSNIYACTATNTWAVGSGGTGGVITHGQAIVGSLDEVQLDITGNSTQTNPVFRVRTSSGANLIQANNDGSVNIGSGSGPEITKEQAAPAGSPASGTEWIWSDATGGFLREKDAAGVTFQMAKEITGLRYANGAGVADSAATAAKITSLFTGCSGTMSLGADGSCHGSSSSSLPDFSTRNGYDDFCGNSANTASGNSGLFQSKMQYSNGGGGTIGNAVSPCGVTMTTAAVTGDKSSIFLYPGTFILIPGTQVFTLTVVFKTSDAANASFSFSDGSDNGLNQGSGNGVAIQALAGGANITLETCSGFSCTSTSSGVAYASNTVYKATMTTNGSGQVCIQVNAGSQVCTSTNVTSTLSSDAAVWFGVKTAAASAVTGTLLGWSYSIPGF